MATKQVNPSRARFVPVPWRDDDDSAPPPLQTEIAGNYGSLWDRICSTFPLQRVKEPHVDQTSASADVDDALGWIPLVRCDADFPLELFGDAVSQLIHHPEYNSTLILRAEILSESEVKFPPSTPRLQGYRPVHYVHRRLLPRRPGRDAALEQHCTLYASTKTSKDGAKLVPSVLVLTPILETGSELPYYHPQVSHLAFRAIPTGSGEMDMLLQMEVIPLDDTPTDLDSRLYRTCLSLLDTLNRYGWGAKTNYKKRVNHDCIVAREPYQDLYLVMRERHKHLVDTWQESTDPLKHVFEDIGIATYLILLWKDMYATPPAPVQNIEQSWLDILKHFLYVLLSLFHQIWMRWGGSVPEPKETSPDLVEDLEPWKKWPRPPAGFLDLGCGNGLLTHILTAEGYAGHGIDVRARVSWSHYPAATQEQLHVQAFDPTGLQDEAETSEYPFLKPKVFIIGNHADELTPWVPVLATLCDASGFINIPCCPWTFDAKYERSTAANYPIEESIVDFTESLKLGGDGSNASAYSMYRVWLGTLTQHCGWKVESETLRIPSTRNWALVGRKHTTSQDGEKDEGQENVQAILESVRERGIFKTRTPEGKAGNH